MAGLGHLGRELILTVGGQSIAGVQTKGLTCNNTPIDVTDDNSSGWRELMAIPGLKTVDVPISGVLKNLELIRLFFSSTNGGSQVTTNTLTYADGSVVTGEFFMVSITETGESNGARTFDSTWQSTGAVTFTPGTGG